MKKVLLSLLIAIVTVTTMSAKVREIFPPFEFNSSYTAIMREMKAATAWTPMGEVKGDFEEEKLCSYYNSERKQSLILLFSSEKLVSIQMSSSQNDNNQIEEKLLKEKNIERAKEWTNMTQLGKEYAKFYKDPETKEVWEFYRGPVSCSISIMTGYASVRIAGHFTPPSK